MRPRTQFRDEIATDDLRRQFSNERYGRIGGQARGAIGVSWYRGEAEGIHRCILWLQRKGHKRAADALKAELE